MANFAYNEAKRALAEAETDYGTGGGTFRVMLNMTATTVDTEDDVNTISGFTNLDEYDGASYARQTLAGQVVNEDVANNRAEFDATDAVFSTLGVGATNAENALVFRFVTTDADSVPQAYIDTGGFPFAGNGGDVTLQWNAEGIIQVT